LNPYRKKKRKAAGKKPLDGKPEKAEAEVPECRNARLAEEEEKKKSYSRRQDTILLLNFTQTE